MYRRSARRRGVTWRVARATFDRLIDDDCAYCDAPPNNVMRTGRADRLREFRYNGIDRIDNDRGYVVGNVVTCCITCNRAKSDLTHADFLAGIGRLVHHVTTTRLVDDADEAELIQVDRDGHGVEA